MRDVCKLLRGANLGLSIRHERNHSSFRTSANCDTCGSGRHFTNNLIKIFGEGGQLPVIDRDRVMIECIDAIEAHLLASAPSEQCAIARENWLDIWDDMRKEVRTYQGKWELIYDELSALKPGSKELRPTLVSTD